MSRLTAFLILIVIWALIYLTNLGSSEFRSEEGHRVLPAVQMLDSGKQLVPYIAARPYLNKPPLINWIVAASFKLSGVRNEWTARLPSALFILAVALALAYLRRALDLSRFRPAGQRSKSRPVLLSYRWRRSLAKSPPPRPNSPGALHRSRGNARHFRDLADLVLLGDTFL